MSKNKAMIFLSIILFSLFLMSANLTFQLIYADVADISELNNAFLEFAFKYFLHFASAFISFLSLLSTFFIIREVVENIKEERG